MANPDRILLVEGATDKRVVSHICAKLSPPIPEFHIEAKNGVSQLLDAIYQAVIIPERTVLGIMLDANDHPDRRWLGVVNRLRKAGVEPPPTPPTDGIIPTTGLPRVGVWMMPDNQSPGELEDFLKEMIRDDDPVWPLAQRYIDDIPLEHRKFQEGKRLRAQVHAWLAAQEEPRPPWQAIGVHDLAIDGPLCERFTEWLRQLFSEPVG